jgi:hypothetical protein
MPYGLKGGLGRTLAEDAQCRSGVFGGFFTPVCWTRLENSPVAPVGAPTGDALTFPPASGEEAQATIDALVNQQMLDQQALNAQSVTSSWWNTLTGGTYGAASGAASGVASALPWILGAVGLGVFALVAIGGGSPRRYGR